MHVDWAKGATSRDVTRANDRADKNNHTQSIQSCSDVYTAGKVSDSNNIFVVILDQFFPDSGRYRMAQ